jgi:hypothetical protein
MSKSKAADRLKQFIEHTNLSMNAFTKECNIKSSRTISKIVTEGASPSSKVLEKIVTRFPQLNYDWVLMGYGEMLIQGFEKQTSSLHSQTKSTQASFKQIKQGNVDLSYQVDSITKDVSDLIKTVSLSTTNLQTQILDLKNHVVQEFNKAENEAENFLKEITRLHNEREELVKEKVAFLIGTLQTKFKEMEKDARSEIINQINKNIDSLFDNFHNDFKNQYKQQWLNYRKEDLEIIDKKLGSFSKTSSPKHQK